LHWPTIAGFLLPNAAAHQTLTAIRWTDCSAAISFHWP
jgi:hypothetical protein